MPRALVPLPSNTVDRLVSRRVSGSGGLAGVVLCCLRELLTNTVRYRPGDAPRLSTLTLNLVAALLAHELDVETSLPPEVHRQALLARIHDFIGHHLADPELSPAVIAAAHHISIRYLHKIFNEHDGGLTVAGFIRQRRLDHCHHDLADPHLRHLPIHAIAARWGFPDKTHFSRLFRTTYGIPPRDYRHLTQHTTTAVHTPSTSVHPDPTSP